LANAALMAAHHFCHLHLNRNQSECGFKHRPSVGIFDRPSVWVIEKDAHDFREEFKFSRRIIDKNLTKNTQDKN
jgi:hypothetical protein